MKFFTVLLVPFILAYFIINYKNEVDIGEILAVNLKNKIYKKFDTLAFDSVFVAELNSFPKNNSNIIKLKKYYNDEGYRPNLVINFFANNNLDSLVKYLNTSHTHGFGSKSFNGNEIELLLDRLKINEFKKVDESYITLARLEILTADAFIRYSNYLKYGLTKPKELYENYQINLKYADSLFIPTLLKSENMLDTLRALQQISPQYSALQNRYISSKSDSIKKILAINMERLRWKLPDVGNSYIQVNIPDFRLIYFRGIDTLATMKVCVGSARDPNYDKKMKIYQQTCDLDDKPQNYETPLLFSNIKKMYTNPTWNIPVSIAQIEVYAMARKNSSYLKNKNIAVYYRKKRVENPSTIRWRKYDREKLPFLFVQQPGEDNSLGKLKFIFPNNSSVYLHDTNVKSAFKLKNRAISHGCIRVEKPLELARLLIADTSQYDSIRKELKLKPLYKKIPKPAVVKKNLKEKAPLPELLPQLFIPKEETPLLITYYTAWINNGKLETRPDIYGMDEKLWLAIKKFK